MKTTHPQQGSLLVTVIILLTLVAIIGVTVITMNLTATFTQIQINKTNRAIQLVESAIRYATLKQLPVGTDQTYTLNNNAGSFHILIIEDNNSSTGYTITVTAKIDANTQLKAVDSLSKEYTPSVATESIVWLKLLQNTNDSSPAAQTIYRHGGTFISDHNGNANSAMLLDADNYDGGGYADYLRISDNDTLDLSDEGTLSLWFKITENRANAGLIHKGTNQNQSEEAYALHFDNNARLVLTVVNSSGQTVNLTTSSSMSIGSWKHATATWGANGMHIYLNGVQIAANSTIISARNTYGALNIGSQFTKLYGYSANDYFHGAIDEVKIFPKELTFSEVQDLYHGNL